MVLIDLVERIPEISLILALRSLSPFEWPYEGDDGLRVVDHPEAAATRQLFVPGHSSPTLVVKMVDDVVEWSVHEDAAQIPLPVRLALAAIGSRKGTNRMDVEVFDDRLRAVDQAWCLLRRLRQAGCSSAAACAARLMSLAAAWGRNRLLIFESRAENRNLLRDRERLREEARSLVMNSPSVISSIGLLEDPRGAALEVSFTGRVHPLALSEAVLDWHIDATFAGLEGNQPERIGEGKYAVRPSKVADHVRGALSTAVIEGNSVRLVKQLDKKTYRDVSGLLTDLGAVWHTGQQAHVFERPARGVLAGVLATGTVYTRRDFEFFETQDKEVQRMLRLAKLRPGMKVLEPSAGRGAIASAAAAIVGVPNVTCYELMADNVGALRRLGFDVSGPMDFLAVPPSPAFDVALLNPPFSGGRDVAHVQHAMGFLRPGGLLVAITSPTWRRGTSSSQRAFCRRLDELGANVQEIEAGAFSAVGTDVATCLITVRAPLAPQAASTAVQAQRQEWPLQMALC